MTTSKYRERTSPRVSANQLAAYMIATASGRNRIIKDARFQRTIVIIQYRETRDAITKFLGSQTRDWKIIEAARGDLAKKMASPGIKAARRDRFQRAADALDEFQLAYNALGIGGVNFRPISKNQPNLEISGVDVSVNLDAAVEAPIPGGGGNYVGGVILQIAKGDGSETELAKAKRHEVAMFATTLINMYATEHLTHRGTPSWRHCHLIDVQRGLLYSAPRNYVQRAQDLSDACAEIADRWDKVEPPPDM